MINGISNYMNSGRRSSLCSRLIVTVAGSCLAHIKMETSSSLFISAQSLLSNIVGDSQNDPLSRWRGKNCEVI